MPRAFAVIIAASAHVTSSRGFIACCGPCEMPIDTVTGPAGSNVHLAQPLGEARRESECVARIARRHDHAELLAADPTDDVGAAHGLEGEPSELDSS